MHLKIVSCIRIIQYEEVFLIFFVFTALLLNNPKESDSISVKFDVLNYTYMQNLILIFYISNFSIKEVKLCENKEIYIVGILRR